jgi:carbamoyltransferase
VILLTDGDNNAGKIAPEYAAHLANTQGVKIYSIQIGSGEAAEVQDGFDLFGQPRYVSVPFPTNPELLRSLAQKTGGAMYVAHELGDRVQPMRTAALGRSWSDDELEQWLITARVPYTRPDDIAEEVAQVLADDGVVAWFQGRAEYGPRALGHRSLLAHPGHERNLERMNDVKGREQFRPVAPMVLLDRAHEVFTGPIPSPYMLFTHGVQPAWKDRIPVVTHVDGSARIQTVDPADEPLVARMLTLFAEKTGIPVVVNTSLNTAGRPIVDDPRDALECFGSGPVDLLALGPFAVRR